MYTPRVSNVCLWLNLTRCGPEAEALGLPLEVIDFILVTGKIEHDLRKDTFVSSEQPDDMHLINDGNAISFNEVIR